MSPRGRPLYKESTPWPGWILVVFWGTMALAMGVVLFSSDTSRSDRILGAVVLGVVAVGVQWLVAGLTVRLYRDGMVVGVGAAGLVSKRVAWEEVEAVESVRYHPLRDFGGWGIRFGKGGRRAWTARGDRAVVLHLRGGTMLYVGSDRPERLEERIRAAAGDRIGGRSRADETG